MTRAFAPARLAEAIRILADPELAAVPVAGCTDLMVVDHAEQRVHPAVVDVLRIPELQGIHRIEPDTLDIGAACTFGQLRRDPLIREQLPILAEAAATIGGWQIQNRATIGGNIANASPAGDSLPVLLALGAKVLIAGPGGERGVDYDRLHVDYRRIALERGELIVRLRVPARAADALCRFRKVGTRAALAISKVVVAFAARRVDRRLADVRVAAGSVAPVPLRLRSVEALLDGATPDARLAERAAAAARDAVQPIDDVRSTAAYRSYVLGRIVRRMVLEAAGGITVS